MFGFSSEELVSTKGTDFTIELQIALESALTTYLPAGAGPLCSERTCRSGIRARPQSRRNCDVSSMVSGCPRTCDYGIWDLHFLIWIDPRLPSRAVGSESQNLHRRDEESQRIAASGALEESVFREMVPKVVD